MANPKADLSKVKGFDWDKANIDKNWKKHKVYYKEAEQIFFKKPLLINFDKKHSIYEERFQALGKTDENRQLSLTFTIRHKKIRIISARDQSRKERSEYEKA